MELAQSYLGTLWAGRVTSGGGAGLIAMIREVSLAQMSPSHAELLLKAARAPTPSDQPALMSRVDVVTTPNELGLVYDYVEAETLRALQSLSSVRRKPMSLDVALRIAMDLLEAVSAMHAGVASRPLFGGLSPDRILIGTDGTTRILDVGFAAAANNIEIFGQHPERIAYAAPEQVGGNPDADPRTDVFTIGIVLWEMLSNRRLFIGSDQAVAQKVLAAKIPRLDQVKRRGDVDLPESLVAIVSRALERDRSARHQTATEMLADLRRVGTPAERAQVAEFVELVSEGTLERRRDAIKDEMRGRSLEPLSSKLPRAPAVMGVQPNAPVRKEAPPPEATQKNAGTNERSGFKSTRIGLPSPRGELPRPPLPQPVRAKTKTIVGIPIAPITGPGTAPARGASAVRSLSSAVDTRSPTAEALRAALTDEEEDLRRSELKSSSRSTAERMAPPQDWEDDFVTTSTMALAGASPRSASTPFGPPVTAVPGAPPEAPPSSRRTDPEASISTVPPPMLPDGTRLITPKSAGDEEPDIDLSPPRVPEVAGTPKPKADMEPAPAPVRRAPTSIPPAAVFPSHIPPPLIHDPRANFRPLDPSAQRKRKKSYARGLIVGTLGAFFVVVIGVGLGLAIMRSRPAPSPPAAIRPILLGEPELQSAAPERPEQEEAPAEAPVGSAVATETESAAAEASAQAPASTTAAEAAPSTAAPTATPKTSKAPVRRAAPRKPKSRKFTPDDI